MVNKIVLLVLIGIFSLRCAQKEKNHTNANEMSPKVEDQTMADGFKLIENNCFSCHSPNPSQENMIAPSMLELKRHYVLDNTSRGEFAKDFKAFLNNPSIENSKIPDAITRFGMMPKMNYTDVEIDKMAAYIFYTEIEKSDWFEQHFQNEKNKYQTSAEQAISPLEKGDAIAKKTKSVLGKNLIQAINTQGTENALSFCSTRAISLTDSVAISLNAKVKRVSDKNRNPNNYANKVELEYINDAKEKLSKNHPIEPKLITVDDKHIGFYPILTNDMCLQCHGKPNSEILPASLTKINQLYPNDKAIGYLSDQLRGIWVVEMDVK